jgi:hypothetical protein
MCAIVFMGTLTPLLMAERTAPSRNIPGVRDKPWSWSRRQHRITKSTRGGASYAVYRSTWSGRSIVVVYLMGKHPMLLTSSASMIDDRMRGVTTTLCSLAEQEESTYRRSHSSIRSVHGVVVQ